MKKDLQLITVNSSGEYIFSVTPKIQTVEGKQKLAQEITKRILTKRGSNYFNPEWGENFYSLIGSADFGREEEIREIIPVMVKNIEEDIIQRQALEFDLTSSEKLLSLNLVDIEIDKEFLGWKIVLSITTQDYSSTKFTVT